MDKTVFKHKFFFHATEESESVHRSETAMRHLEEFGKIKDFIQELHERVETEAGSITQVKRWCICYWFLRYKK